MTHRCDNGQHHRGFVPCPTGCGPADPAIPLLASMPVPCSPACRAISWPSQAGIQYSARLEADASPRQPEADNRSRLCSATTRLRCWPVPQVQADSRPYADPRGKEQSRLSAGRERPLVVTPAEQWKQPGAKKKPAKATPTDAAS
jgi:hypothetical protein